ncbi:MAG: hypothetical protein JO108_32550 [Acidobacteriaceae bacterium]|nr:hypothetical protein [Acidobacteriaceae bacterium]
MGKALITIGACATSGGIQALRNWRDTEEMVRAVYATPQYISTLKLSTPISEHVQVDFELRGCPINKYQLIELITATLAGRKPNIPASSVCVECKRKGNVCVLVAHGTPCLGPVTHAGAVRSVRATPADAMAATDRWRRPIPNRCRTNFAYWARATRRSLVLSAVSTRGHGRSERPARKPSAH